MEITIVLILLAAAGIACIASALGKCPLWVSVILTIIACFLGLTHVPLK